MEIVLIILGKFTNYQSQGCTKGQKSGGAGSNAARGGVPPPPGGAF